MNNLQAIATGVAGLSRAKLAFFALTTVAFAVIARLVRGVTSSGAVAGGVVCFVLMLGAGWAGFALLCSVFLMTWAATRVGYGRKNRLGSAERHGGRNAGQVFANLSVAAIAAVAHLRLGDARWLVAMSAALTEVAADTISSEIGLVLGGTPRLVTTWQAVEAGSDGAITALGTLAGLIAALAVSFVCAATYIFPFRYFFLCAAAAMVGTLADSLLGATLERTGVLGNNAVNFISTAVAAGVAWAFAN